MDQYVHDGFDPYMVGFPRSSRRYFGNRPTPLRSPARVFQMVIRVLMDRADGTEEDPERKSALAELNTTLAREGLQTFYCDDSICFLRSTKTGEDSRPDPVVDRALSQEEMDRRETA